MFLGEEEKNQPGCDFERFNQNCSDFESEQKNLVRDFFGRTKNQKSIELVKKFPVNFQIDLNRFLRFWASVGLRVPGSEPVGKIVVY